MGSSTRTGPKPWVPKPGQHPHCPSPGESHQHRSPSHQPRGSLLFVQASNKAGTPGGYQQHHIILLLQPSLRNKSPVKLEKAIPIKKYIFIATYSIWGFPLLLARGLPIVLLSEMLLNASVWSEQVKNHFSFIAK